MAITPDEKDWTWTLERRCPECSFDARTVPVDAIADETLRLTAPWAQVLARPDVRTRPRQDVWSPLEYGCHVRDVCQVFAGRVDLILSHDETESQARFDNWDQDATAIEQRYADQDPAEVAVRLDESAVRASAAFAAVGPVGADQWGRRGLRSNGSAFTVASLGRYFLHDLAHHLVDVGA